MTFFAKLLGKRRKRMVKTQKLQKYCKSLKIKKKVRSKLIL